MVVLHRLLRQPAATAIVSRYSSKSENPWRLKTSYKWFLPIQTRVIDNDMFGHMNNAVHHTLFDTAINVYLTNTVGLDMAGKSTCLGYMVDTGCTYYTEASYPNVYMSGVSLSKMGRTSLTYQTALFAIKEAGPNTPLLNLFHGHSPADPLVGDLVAPMAAATGQYTHVFVDPVTQRPVPLPQDWKDKLSHMLVTH